MCVCVCVFPVKLISPLSQSLARHAGVSEVLKGLLRCLGDGITRGDARGCSGGLAVASLKETRGVLWRVGGDITQGDVGIALTFCLCVFRLHHSRVPRRCSGGFL